MTFAAEKPVGAKAEIYRELALQARGLFEGERDWLANAANLASLIYGGLDDLNWSGFYLMKEGELVLGPFQGKPACVRIALGKGVCGAAAERRETLVVADVDEFPGHIACDSASRSELVVPLIVADKVVGVLDIDSPSILRFDLEDLSGVQLLADIYLRASNDSPKR